MPEISETHAKLKSIGACRPGVDVACDWDGSPQAWKGADVDQLVWLLTRKPFCDALGADRVWAATRAVVDKLAAHWTAWTVSNHPSQKGAATVVLHYVDAGDKETARRKADLALIEIKAAEHESKMFVIQSMKGIRAMTLDRPTRALGIACACAKRSGAIADIPAVIRGVLTYAEIAAAVESL